MPNAITTDASSLLTGNVLQVLKANNWDIDKALRTNAALPHDAWIAIDNTVIEIAKQRLNGIADLRSGGLVRNLPGGLGVIYDYWQTMSQGADAEQSMSGVTPGAKNKVTFNEVAVPIPLTFVDFSLDARTLAAMARNGTPFDTTLVADATQRVIEKLEDALFNGSAVVAGGNSLPGYINYTNSNSVSCTGSWGTTPTNIEKDVVILIKALETDRHYGPYILYVHTDEWAALRQRDSSAGGITYYDIVKSMKGIQDVKVSDALSDGNIVLVEMTRGVVDLSTAIDLKVVEWPTNGGMSTDFKVLAAIAARIKADDDGRCGVAFDSSIP